VAQPLLAPTGNGVSVAGISVSGSGFIETPLVSITGGGGTGATGVATISPTGALTGITITNPGIGYTTAPIITVSGGGGTGTIGTAPAPVANVSGGFTKKGSGSLTLTASSTYTGATTINSGTLRLGTGAVPAQLVAAYSFDNTTATPQGTPSSINSSVGTAATLTGTVGFAGGVTIVGGGPTINGSSGNALNFDGTGGVVDIPNPITDLSGTGNWTVSTWLQTTEQGATIFSKDTNSTWGNGNSIFYLGDGTGGASSNGSGSYPSAVRYAGGFESTNTSVTDGNWHMITYVDSGGTRSIYVDGVLTTLSQTGFTTADVGNLIEIGYTPDTVAKDGPQPLYGSLDDLNFFNGALSAAQIASLYTTNLAGPASANNILPSTTAVNIPTAGATLDLYSDVQQIGSLTGVSGSLVTLGGGTLIVGDSTSTTFAGNISDTGGLGTGTGGNLIKVGTGTLTLSGTDTYSGGTMVTAGTLNLTTAAALPTGTALSIAANASTVAVAHAAGASNGVLQVSALNFAGTSGAWGGLLDLNNNDIIVHGGSLATVTSQVQQGYNGGAWNGTGGIISTSAATISSHLTTLGVIVNDHNGTPLYGSGGSINATFDGATPVDGDILVKYTYYGDANLDGAVDGSDYTLIDAGFASNGALTGWYNGDFNYDGKIDGSDYTLIDNAFNTQGASLGSNPAAIIASNTAQFAGGSSAVPEPATLGLLGVTGIGLLGRRRRRI
jgi:autotransporter-associated beta strand protein